MQTSSLNHVAQSDQNVKLSMNSNDTRKPTIEGHFTQEGNILITETPKGDEADELPKTEFTLKRLPSGSLISQENMDLGRQQFLRQFLKKTGFTSECRALINSWLKELDLYGNKLLILQNKKIEDLEVDDYQREIEITALQEQAKARDEEAAKYSHYVGLHDLQTANIEKNNERMEKSTKENLRTSSFANKQKETNKNLSEKAKKLFADNKELYDHNVQHVKELDGLQATIERMNKEAQDLKTALELSRHENVQVLDNTTWPAIVPPLPTPAVVPPVPTPTSTSDSSTSASSSSTSNPELNVADSAIPKDATGQDYEDFDDEDQQVLPSGRYTKGDPPGATLGGAAILNVETGATSGGAAIINSETGATSGGAVIANPSPVPGANSDQALTALLLQMQKESASRAQREQNMSAPQNVTTKIQSAHKVNHMRELDSTSVSRLLADIKMCKRNNQDYNIDDAIHEDVQSNIATLFYVRKYISDLKDRSWLKWETKTLIDRLRLVLNEKDMVDENGTTRSLKELQTAMDSMLPWGLTMKGDGQESHAKNIAALGKINSIIVKGVNSDLLADCSKDGKMSEIREAILEHLEKDTRDKFGSGCIMVVRRNLQGMLSWEQVYLTLYMTYDNDVGLWHQAQRLSGNANANSKYPRKEKEHHDRGGRGSGRGGGRDSNPSGGRGRGNTGGRGGNNPPGKRVYTQEETDAYNANKRQKTDNYSLCQGCGKTHGPVCLLKGGDPKHPHVKCHPDYNHENKPWLKCTKGLAWLEKGKHFTSLPCRRTLSGAAYECHPDIAAAKPYKGNPTQLQHMCMQCNAIDDALKKDAVSWNRKIMFVKPKANCTLPPLRLNALLDSGSLGEGGNYISKEVGDALRLRGYKGRKTIRTVCSCFANDCRKISNDLFTLKLTYSDTLHDADNTVILEVVEMNTTHDLIVGYETLSLQQELRNALVTQLNEGQPVDEPLKPEPTDTTSAEGSSYPPGTTKSRKKSRVMQAVVDKRSSLNAAQTSNPSGTRTEDSKAAEILSMMQIDGTDTLQGAIRSAVTDLIKAFSMKLNKEAAHITPMDLKFLPDSVWHTGANSQPPRQQSRLKAEEILIQIDKMLAAGIIRASQAQSYSQVMMTPKKDGTWRFCVDFRRLNAITEPNRFPLPRIDNLLKRLGDKHPKYFAVLDLTKGYYQAPLAEAAKILTAFITPNGLFEWNRVAMGLTGAPGFFQRAMQTEVLRGDLLYQCCEIYLDDIVVFGATEEEFILNLRKVLTRLIEHNVTINPSKCQIGLSEIEYVGHTVNSEGTHFSREKLQKVINFNRPRTGKQLRSFLGLANYFREHVSNHSARVEPLTRLLDAYDAKKTLDWEDRHTAAFEDVQKAINECPALFFMDYTSPVHLYTDASDIGIGGYLCQIRDGKEHPIAFYSKSLTKEEKKWGTPALEGYAIFRAFQHFDYLLRDCHTTVHTDHLNLIYIKDSVEGKVIRWKLALQEYSFELLHVRGVDNPIGDYMSRNEAAEEDDYVIDEPRKAINMLNSMTSHFGDDEAPCCQSCADKHVPTFMVADDFVMYSNEPSVDPTCGLCNTVNQMNQMETETRFSIPPEAYQAILNAHDDVVGHHGVEATLEMLNRQGKNWPFRREHVRRFIRDCGWCQKNTYTGYEVQIPRYVAGRYQPMERLAVDCIHLPKSLKDKDSHGSQYIVSVIDCFSRFLTLHAIPALNKETVADCILNHAGTFGIPSELISDRGSGDFYNDVVKEMLDRIGTRQFTTLAHSKEENSIVERSNKETWRWLRALLYDKRIGRNQVTKALPFVARIHNATKKRQNGGFSPAQILFGTRVELDRNILLTETERNNPQATITEWMADREKLQNSIIAMAKEQQEKTDKKNKVLRANTDKENGNTEFPINSYVLVSYPKTEFGNRRPNKITTMHHGPYQVTERDGINYTLQNLVSKKNITKAVFLLRPFHFDATRTDPHTIALKDYDDEFYVDQIIGHTGRFSRLTGKDKITFTVRWEGYDTTYDTEGTFGDLKWNTVFREYVTAQGFERILPKDD